MKKPQTREKAVLILLIVLLGVVSFAIGSVIAKKRVRMQHFSQNFQTQEEGEMMIRKPEVIGKITSIVGNEITIAKLEKPQNEFVNKSDEERKAYFESLTPEERIARFEARMNAFSGEDITISIPAGISIVKDLQPRIGKEELKKLSKEKGENPFARETTSITFNELKEGDYLVVWLDNENIENNLAQKIALINF